MTKYKCVKIDRHENVPKEIESHEKEGWKLVTYTAVSPSTGMTKHYILLQRD